MVLVTRTGRPRAININPSVVADLLKANRRPEGTGPGSQAQLALAAGISPGFLTDMIRQGKGTNLQTIERMAEALGCQPSTLAPTLVEEPVRFMAVRDGDPIPDEAA